MRCIWLNARWWLAYFQGRPPRSAGDDHFAGPICKAPAAQSCKPHRAKKPESTRSAPDTSHVQAFVDHIWDITHGWSTSRPGPGFVAVEGNRRFEKDWASAPRAGGPTRRGEAWRGMEPYQDQQAMKPRTEGGAWAQRGRSYMGGTPGQAGVPWRQAGSMEQTPRSSGGAAFLARLIPTARPGVCWAPAGLQRQEWVGSSRWPGWLPASLRSSQVPVAVLPRTLATPGHRQVRKSRAGLAPTQGNSPVAVCPRPAHLLG